MKLSVIQPDPVWENKTLNLSNLRTMLSPLFSKTDLVILPEMFTTGFSMNADALSEPDDSDTYLWMKDMSRDGNFGICGSYIVKDKEKFYNRWLFVGPENEKWIYDKRHTFSIGGEDRHFASGKNRLVFTFRGMRISPYICYDLRFPVWSRNRNDTDLILYSANWPATRRNVWNILLNARAIENQCYVAGANRVGTDGNGVHYSGESAIIDPRGEIIAFANTGIEQYITAEVSPEELSDFRKRFPVLDDADHFTITP